LLCGVGHPPAQREMFGIIGRSGSDFGLKNVRIGGMPKNCSGYCTIGLRDCNLRIFGIAHNCSGSGHRAAGVCNSKSEQQLLLLKIGVFGVGDREQLFGLGVLAAGWYRDTPGNSLPAPRIFPGSISSRPAESRARELPGEITRTIVRRTPGCPAVPGEDPPVTRLDKKIYLRG
jgi:hypothetical protein